MCKKYYFQYQMTFNKKYDLIIAGGGLAGLTLALQMKLGVPGISILVLEKRNKDAPVATHKVGESLSEMAAYYLREMLDLKTYLTECHVRKFGFRFFFSPEHANDLTRRVEVGSKIFNPFPSHQVDRGVLENELVRRLKDLDVEIMLGAKVRAVELSGEGQQIWFEVGGVEYRTEAKWIVDSTGRSSLLKRKLGLEKEIGHDINSSWFRLDVKIDIDDWSENLDWRNFVDPGRRYLATNHLMGEGYWVWIIPLADEKTSIGIVADPVYHPFDTFNSFEKAMEWLEKYEPQAARMFGMHKEKLMDFKVMKNFAYDSKQFYSNERWALTGEAGAFMDPFYSPGSDMIALGNTWITDLVTRDLRGEDISLRALVYDLAHKELLGGWIKLYRNMYGIFGKTQVMLMKIIWDWASYWAVPNVLFINKGYTDLDILKQYSSSVSSIGRRFANLNDHMQELFREWGKHETENCSDQQLNVFDLDCLRMLQSELGKQYHEGLMAKIESNLEVLEQIAAEIFRLSGGIGGQTPDELKSVKIPDSIRADIAKMWFSKIKTQDNVFA